MYDTFLLLVELFCCVICCPAVLSVFEGNLPHLIAAQISRLQ